MSFAGHVYDMIRRSKENKETLQRLRERTREARWKYIGDGKHPKDPEISLEELLQIERQLKLREAEESHFRFRIITIIIGVGIIFSLLFIELFLHYF